MHFEVTEIPVNTQMTTPRVSCKNNSVEIK